MRHMVMFGVVLFAAGCDLEETKVGTDTGTAGGGDSGDTDAEVDADGDGFPEGEDCDDADAAINPDSSEVCDSVDNDCDALIDDADDSLDLATASTWFGDLDGDGYGSDELVEQACEQPVDAVSVGGDCLDDDASVSPGAAEICDGVDNDCDGLLDDADDSLDQSTASTYYADSDGDGFGDVDNQTLACSPSSAYVADSTDCDDSAGSVYPGAREACNGVDDDCDPSSSEDGTIDVAGSGYGSLEAALAAASSGDTVTLCDGVYTGAFTVPDGLTLTSYNGAASTTLESDGSAVAILTLEGGVDILDLTFRGGFALYGGAIDGYSGAVTGGSIAVYNSVFEGNEAGFGGAILANLDHTLTLADSTFTGNTAGVTDGTDYYGSGGAVYAADLDVQNCLFEDNAAYFGGAVYIAGIATFDSATSISGNTAGSYGDSGSGYGGGFMGNAADISFDDTTIEDNAAAYFGGGGFTFNSDITGGAFTGNEATASGGGLYYFVDDANTLTEASFASNTAANGGGVAFDGDAGGGIITASDLLFETNYASEMGGGAWMVGAIVDLTDTTFDANEALSTGGATHIGGGTEGTEVLLVCDNVEAYDNAAANGGGYYVDGSELDLSGGMVAGNSATDDGGGAYLTDSQLDSDTVDWDSSGSDNSPDDVYVEDVETGYDSYGTSESFGCDSAGCE